MKNKFYIFLAPVCILVTIAYYELSLETRCYWYIKSDKMDLVEMLSNDQRAETVIYWAEAMAYKNTPVKDKLYMDLIKDTSEYLSKYYPNHYMNKKPVDSK